ncbi:MAG: hypothetical protein JO310_12845 [Hyphomicrobiales bacterium]|nr:hypothetical protein [Hyphomicrobiales bacterium]
MATRDVTPAQAHADRALISVSTIAALGPLVDNGVMICSSIVASINPPRPKGYQRGTVKPAKGDRNDE